MKRFISLISLIAIALFTMPVNPIHAALTPNGPITGQATGSHALTSTGVICTLGAPGAAASGYTIIIDATQMATSTCTVNIQVLVPTDGSSPGTYVTPTAWYINGVATVSGSLGTLTITNGDVYVYSIPGGVPGIQVNLAGDGSATGTISASISVY